MALWIIGILAIVLMIVACLPITQRYFHKYIEKIGYWSLLIIFIIYLLIDIWYLLKISDRSGNFWLAFILVNIAGIIALCRTYWDIKNSK